VKHRAAILLIIVLIMTLAVYGSTTTVYYTPKGAKYHRLGCSTLSRSKTVYSCTIEKAKAMGLEPCKVCKP